MIDLLQMPGEIQAVPGPETLQQTIPLRLAEIGRPPKKLLQIQLPPLLPGELVNAHADEPDGTALHPVQQGGGLPEDGLGGLAGGGEPGAG